MQQQLEHTAALQAFVSALVERGDALWEDADGRIVMQDAIEPWIFEALCLLYVSAEDLEPDSAG